MARYSVYAPAGVPPHKCPHDSTHLSGYETCRTCGDYRVCAECGMEYIIHDSGGHASCWMCQRVAAMRAALANAEREQAERRTQYQQASA